MIIKNKELLDQLSKITDGWINVQIGDKIYPIIGVEDSQCFGWWEIRYCSSFISVSTMDVKTLISLIPESGMIMIQEDNHLGRSYPIDCIKEDPDFIGTWSLVCEDSEKDYWEELEKAYKEGKIYND